MPFLSGFGKRKEIRYGTTFPGANLTGFPKLIEITTDLELAAELALGGGIAVTLDDGTTTVPFGLYPSSNLALGTLILRAKFPTLLTAASTGDVLGYLYYDSGQTTSEDKAGVVDNGYALFMPLEEDPSGGAPQMRDWVTDTLLGTSSGSMTSGDLVAAQVANGLDFDGSNDAIDLGDVAPGTSDMTVTAWIKRAATGTRNEVMSKESGAAPRGYELAALGGDKAEFGVFSAAGFPTVQSSGTLSAATWYMLTGTRNAVANELKIYIDGTLDGTASAFSGDAPADDTTHLFLARKASDGSRQFQGIIDEVTVSNVTRSADWIGYAYDDDSANSDTFSLGAEEEDGGGGDITADLSVTLSAPSLSSTSSVTVLTSSSTTLAAISLSSASSVLVVASSSVTLAGPSLSSALTVTVTADSSTTLAGPSLSSGVLMTVTVDASVTLSGPSLSSSSLVTVTADASVTLAGPVLSSNIGQSVVAELNVTLSAPTLSATLVHERIADLSITLAGPTLSSTIITVTILGPLIADSIDFISIRQDSMSRAVVNNNVNFISRT